LKQAKELKMSTQKTKDNKPTHYVRTLVGHGKNSHFETIGVAWKREHQDMYVKLHGTQIVEGGFYILPNNASATEA